MEQTNDVGFGSCLLLLMEGVCVHVKVTVLPPSLI